ncbi:MAG: DUF3536 domain-containing protein, partial [Deltaproteobacteria bacterium]|nr:DUF3536 domain-containing protein [Deltaproteobacteria bacterium]
IMPLAAPLDKKVEVRWALDDFRARFGREAEGMWLAECAVDTPTLEVLAEAGVRFVSLAPRQAEAVSEDGLDYSPVNGNPDISRPYKITLPSGREIAAFFYHGSLAQAVAFEGLLADGEKFWRKLRQSCEQSLPRGGILSMATDGETYGHHFKFGEMSLAYLLEQGRQGRDGVEFTNFGAYLAENPPTAYMRLYESSSWSCMHGIERWRSNCGCKDGGHPDWNQEWRSPLRQVMNEVKSRLDEHFFQAGREVFKNAAAALLDFGQVLADQGQAAAFAARHFIGKNGGKAEKAWQFLRMQESALAAFASCAWFFDDLSRIEPVKALSFALRAMELSLATGGPDLRTQVEKMLEAAHSNKPEEGSGRQIFRNRVLPTRQDAASLCLFSYLHAYCNDLLPADCDGRVSMVYPTLKVELQSIECPAEACCMPPDQTTRPDARLIKGLAVIGHPEAAGGRTFAWEGLLPARDYDNKVFLGNAGLTAKTADGRAFRRESRDLARHLHDFLNVRMLRRTADIGAADRTLTLRHCISNLASLEEGQTTQPFDDLWSELLPYLPVACLNWPDGGAELRQESLEQAARIMRRNSISPSLRNRCMELVSAEALRLLDSGENGGLDDAELDNELARGVRRVAFVLPEMNWWEVQNRLWSRNLLGAYPKTAEAVGFKM